MRKTLTLAIATTALTAAIGVPVWGVMQANADDAPRPFAALFDDAAQTLPLFLTSGKYDDEARSHHKASFDGHDDDDCDDGGDDGDDDHDEQDDDDDDCQSGPHSPAPAGTVTPPQNGLFGNGAPPQVQVN